MVTYSKMPTKMSYDMKILFNIVNYANKTRTKLAPCKLV